MLFVKTSRHKICRQLLVKVCYSPFTTFFRTTTLTFYLLWNLFKSYFNTLCIVLLRCCFTALADCDAHSYYTWPLTGNSRDRRFCALFTCFRNADLVFSRYTLSKGLVEFFLLYSSSACHFWTKCSTCLKAIKDEKKFSSVSIKTLNSLVKFAVYF